MARDHDESEAASSASDSLAMAMGCLDAAVSAALSSDGDLDARVQMNIDAQTEAAQELSEAREPAVQGAFAVPRTSGQHDGPTEHAASACLRPSAPPRPTILDPQPKAGNLEVSDASLQMIPGLATLASAEGASAVPGEPASETGPAPTSPDSASAPVTEGAQPHLLGPAALVMVVAALLALIALLVLLSPLVTGVGA